MDLLEKELYSKYGNRQIGVDEVEMILNDAAKRGLISAVDKLPDGPYTVPRIMEHISKLRREFLFDDCLGISNEGGNASVGGLSEETATDPHLIDQVLRAYFDYEKKIQIKQERKPRSKLRWLLLASMSLVAGGFLFSQYVPRPY